jgi:hypothetical protein
MCGSETKDVEITSLHYNKNLTSCLTLLAPSLAAALHYIITTLVPQQHNKDKDALGKMNKLN